MFISSFTCGINFGVFYQNVVSEVFKHAIKSQTVPAPDSFLSFGVFADFFTLTFSRSFG